MRTTERTAVTAIATCAAAALLLASTACSPEESEEGDGSIVFWTPYTTPERIALSNR